MCTGQVTFIKVPEKHGHGHPCIPETLLNCSYFNVRYYVIKAGGKVIYFWGNRELYTPLETGMHIFLPPPPVGVGGKIRVISWLGEKYYHL